MLIAHLLKWQFQPAHRSSGWRCSIRQRGWRGAQPIDQPLGSWARATAVST
ncbi:MAG TPA: DUF29 family protein [Lamprocystis sp. (in: g-proteobacteria)]|nr:DUF29 family protein [Lamprocystis sp. (in: g-proteobacteria)]